MMYKKRIVVILMFIFIFVNYKVYAESIPKVLIIYDKKNIFSFSTNYMSSIDELLGAFKVNTTCINVNDYIQNTSNSYDYVFVMGIDGKDLNNQIFLNDLKVFSGKIFWLGKGIDFFIKDNPKYELVYDGEKTNCNKLYYSNKRDKDISYKDMESFILGTNTAFSIIHSNNKDAKVYSYLSDEKETYPFAINENNLWYISRFDSEIIEFYIFSDILNDFFKTESINKNKAYVRIEDVHPFRDVDNLKKIADYLFAEDVPFLIALIPAYVNPDTGYITTISDKPDFAEAIRYMQERGGTVILHGFTHQNKHKSYTGEGFEFWDGEKDEPLNEDIEKYVYDRIEKGIKECLQNDIYPLGFEAPHYAVDSSGYKELKKYFSTYSGHYQNNDYKFATTTFPYILNNTKSFNKLLPENLGYIDTVNPLCYKEIKENFRALSTVRGFCAGFFFHSYLEVEKMKDIITLLKEANLEFIDLKNEANWVKCDNIAINSEGGTINVSGFVKENTSNNKKEPEKESNYVSNINKTLTFIIGFFCIVFAFIFIASKKIDNNKFIR